MPRFVPVTTTTTLPPVGAGAEHALWDLKKGISAQEFHNAKDVAAFANHLGGTLLIGAEEDGTGCVGAYWPMTAAAAAQAEVQLERAIENRCHPQPLVNYARVPHGNGFILAVNVWPVTTAPVGVSIKGDKADGYSGTAYAFPIRLTNQTTWIPSDNLAMHMLPQLRRNLVLLAMIPEGEPVLHVPKGANGRTVAIKSIDEHTNTMGLQSSPGGSMVYIPLDSVISVFRVEGTAPPYWRVMTRHD